MPLDAFVARHRWAVLVVWAVLVAVAAPFAARQSDHLTGGGFEIAGSQSQQVEDVVTSDVPVDFRPATLAAVLVRHGPTSKADVQAAVKALARAARATPGVKLDRQFEQTAVYLATQRPRRPAVVPLTVEADEFHAPDVARELRDRLGLDDNRRYGGVTLHLVGQGALWAAMLDVTEHDLASAERLGFPLILVILLAVFGSAVTALLPLALGAVAVTVTGAVISWLSTVTTMHLFVPNMASMIGLGVAVDYCLFVVVRYREELRAGASPDRARSAAMRTSGVAVMFSGAAVIVALAGLFFVDAAAVRSLAAGAIVVVAVAMLACATLLPALLAIAARRIRPGTTRPSRVFARWAEAVLRRPAVSLAVALAILLALAVPALSLHTGDGALRQLPADGEARAGFDAAISQTGPGRGSPIKILVARKDADATVRTLLADPEVVKTGVRTQTRDGRRLFVVSTPRHDGDSDATKELIARLRRTLPSSAVVGGNSAAQVDFNHAIDRGMWKVLAWIVLTTFVVLLVVVRSPAVALQAVIANLLSVAAALGVLTAVFGQVNTLTVPIVLAVVSGLSMDYEVFLLTRIRERHLTARASTRQAIHEGLASSARTISSAALIMVAVFGVFALTGVPAIKEIGLGCAVAIAVDATVVRLGLVPAVMALLGERCWPRSERREKHDCVRIG